MDKTWHYTATIEWSTGTQAPLRGQVRALTEEAARKKIETQYDDWKSVTLVSYSIIKPGDDNVSYLSAVRNVKNLPAVVEQPAEVDWMDEAGYLTEAECVVSCCTYNGKED